MEKLKIWYHSFFRTFVFHVFFWFVSLLFYVFLTGELKLFNNCLITFIPDFLLLHIFVLALFLSSIFTILDSMLTDRLSRVFPLKFFTITRTFFYFTIVLLIFLPANYKLNELKELLSGRNFELLLNGLDLSFFRFLVYFYLVAFLNNIFKDMVKRVGRGNYIKWLFGLLKKPIEEERIFMFIDMKSSTHNAERLGHEKFSFLVQDFFNDLSIVDNYNGEIYQYLGDGAIISWNLKAGLTNDNCIKSFFAFERVIERGAKKYKKKYGMIPNFKAGMHVGKIMVLQVGTIRRDISYNGDTLNTAARIESLCSEMKRKLLISEDLFRLLPGKNKYLFKHLDNNRLKGKRRKIEIYEVRKKNLQNHLS